MASSLFAKRSAGGGGGGNESAEEKKNEGGGGGSSIAETANDDSPSESSGTEEDSDAAAVSAEEDDGGEVEDGSAEAETASVASDAATAPSDGGDPTDVGRGGGAPPATIADDDDDAETTPAACPRWSVALSTPSDRGSAFAPSSEATTSTKLGLHGLGLRYAVDRTKVLSRTGKQCSALLLEIATLNDELVKELGKLCPSALEGATNGTPMEDFARGVGRCISSFVEQNQNLGGCIRRDLAKPYQENGAALAEEGARQYAAYAGARGRCAQARREALKLRRKYVDAVREAEGAVSSLGKARAARSRKRGNAESSDEDGEEAAAPSFASWEEELRQFGERNGLPNRVEAVVRASEEVNAAQARYSVGVAEENAAVDEAQNVERTALDAVQRLEEERIVFLIGLLDRFLQDEKESLENMSLDLASVEPLDLEDGIRTELTVSTSSLPTSASTPTSLFMSPRRRAQSDDGPAINETRLLNLPDNIAETRDNMKSLIVRQLGRLKTLKEVAAFNEDMASAIESFAAELKSHLGNNTSAAVLNKNEGANVLGSWNSAIGSLAAYAKCADTLAKQIRNGNHVLQQNLVPHAEKEARALQEAEEYRWKSLCDSARVEAKAKAKHKQCAADLEKARARLTQVEGEGSEGAAGDSDASSNGFNVSPMKASTKMDRHMNKAMGKMFAILPGGGEDMMNKVLTPQQRQAIANRQLDEALAKEEKGTESFEVARSVRQQAAASYQTESEAAEFKFKSDERNEWNEMQTSLVCCVAAMRNFRTGHLESVTSAIDAVRERHLGSKALGDVTRWTAYTRGRLEDQRASVSVDDSKEEGQSGEGGFCLRVQLVEGADVKDLVRNFLDEKDVVADDAEIDNGEEPAAEPSSDEINAPPKEIDDDDDAVAAEEVPTATPPAPAPPLPDVPPDPLIDKMDSIFSKRLEGVSIDRFYHVAWSEDAPLYGPWLERKGSFEVSVTDWERSPSPEGDFVNSWSKEKFSQKRIIKFKFRRTTHLYIGPPIAGVTQTQYLMKEGDDRCVVMMTVEMDGIPYSDSFAVEVRWSARRVNQNDIAVDAGVFVRFTKSNMFAGKIKSGTLKETSPIHLDLFEVIKSALASDEKGGEIESPEAESNEETKATAAKEEMEEEVKTPTRVEPATKVEMPARVERPARVEILTSVRSPPPAEGGFQRLVSAFFSLTRTQQLLLAFVVLYVATKAIFPAKDPRADAIDDLTRKVDDLTDELREMKAMLGDILEMSERSVAGGTGRGES